MILYREIVIDIVKAQKHLQNTQQHNKLEGSNMIQINVAYITPHVFLIILPQTDVE